MDRGELGAQARGFGRSRSRHRRGRKPAVVVGEFLVPGLKLFELTGEGSEFRGVASGRGQRGRSLARLEFFLRRAQLAVERRELNRRPADLVIETHVVGGQFRQPVFVGRRQRRRRPRGRRLAGGGGGSGAVPGRLQLGGEVGELGFRLGFFRAERGGVARELFELRPQCRDGGIGRGRLGGGGGGVCSGGARRGFGGGDAELEGGPLALEQLRGGGEALVEIRAFTLRGFDGGREAGVVGADVVEIVLGFFEFGGEVGRRRGGRGNRRGFQALVFFGEACGGGTGVGQRGLQGREFLRELGPGRVGLRGGEALFQCGFVTCQTLRGGGEARVFGLEIGEVGLRRREPGIETGVAGGGRRRRAPPGRRRTRCGGTGQGRRDGRRGARAELHPQFRDGDVGIGELRRGELLGDNVATGGLRPVFHGDGKPGIGLGQIGRAAAAFGEKDAQIVLRRSVVLQRGGAVEIHGRRGVGSGTAALLEHQREVVRGARVALVRGGAIPLLRRHFVLGQTPAQFVGQGEIVLALGNAALRGLIEP